MATCGDESGEQLLQATIRVQYRERIEKMAAGLAEGMMEDQCRCGKEGKGQRTMTGVYERDMLYESLGDVKGANGAVYSGRQTFVS